MTPPVRVAIVDDHPMFRMGLAAMRERATELGGTVHVLANSPRGTRVHVRLPAALP